MNLKKMIIVVTSRDVEEKDQAAVANNLMSKLQTKSFEDNLADHTEAWKKRWETSDVEISGDDAAQQGIRFNICQYL